MKRFNLKDEATALGAFLVAFSLTLAGCGGSASGGDTKNMVYGSPESKLSMEPASGPLYEGTALSIAPEVKPV
ncbi:MAG: hypothetical protein ACRECJ_06750, partial [Limisphaerales bacterium]